jgi:hypothetical protein
MEQHIVACACHWLCEAQPEACAARIERTNRTLSPTHTHPIRPASSPSSISIKQSCQPAGGGSAAISAVCLHSSTTGPQGRCNILRARSSTQCKCAVSWCTCQHGCNIQRHPRSLWLAVSLTTRVRDTHETQQGCMPSPAKETPTHISRQQYVHTHGLKTAAGQHDTRAISPSNETHPNDPATKTNKLPTSTLPGAVSPSPSQTRPPTH